MSFKARLSGVFNSITGFIVRLITACIVAIALWWLAYFAVDIVLNFFANKSVDTVSGEQFTCQTPMGMAIRGVICGIAFLWVLFRRVR
jgi:hypothetical protein